MLNIYLFTARYLLVNGYRDEACKYLSLALGECNKTVAAELWHGRYERQHVMAALSYARRA